MRHTYVLKQVNLIYGLAFLMDFTVTSDTPVWCLTRLWVVERYRGHHYGSILLERVIRDADREGVRLVLEVKPDDSADSSWVFSFYERHGFRPLDEGAPYTLMRTPKKENAWALSSSSSEQ